MDTARYGTQHSRQATLLLESVQRMEKRRNGRCAVHLCLSRMASEAIPSQNLRVAVSIFEAGIRGLEGELFVLDNFDIVFIGTDAEAAPLRSVVERVEVLLHNDPATDKLSLVSDFARWFDLTFGYESFLNHVRQLAIDEEQQRLDRASGNAVDARMIPREELDLTGLAALERALNTADISSLVRRQAVCAIGKNMRPSRVLTEFFTSIREVEKVLSPDTDLSRNRLLFQYLTQILDRRMLSYLKQNTHQGVGRYISLNLNVASLTSQAFLAFDAALPVGVRGKIIIELQQSDVYADLRTYSFARDLARQQGYKLCLDGVTRHSLSLIDRDGLGMEFVKLLWSEDLRSVLEGRGRGEIERAIERIGTQHMILHRCETEEIVKIGHELGVQLFQGHHIDALLPMEEQKEGRSALDSTGRAR